MVRTTPLKRPRLVVVLALLLPGIAAAAPPGMPSPTAAIILPAATGQTATSPARGTA